MKTINSLLLMIILLVQAVYGQNSGMPLTMTLKECVGYAQKHNTGVRLSELERQKSRWSKLESLSMGLPKVEINSSFENYLKLPVLIVPGEIFGQPGENIPVEFGTKYNINAALQATQMLYNQSYFTSRKIAKHVNELSSINVEKAKEDISIESAKIYYSILATKRQIEILRESFTNIAKLYNITKIQLDNGLVKKIDLQKIEVSRNHLSAQICNLESIYKCQMKILSLMLDIPCCQKIELTDSLHWPIIQYEFADRIANKSEMKILEKQETIAGLELRASKEKLLPSLSAFYSYTFQAQREEMDMFSGGGDKWYKIGVLGFNLTIPVFSGLYNGAKIKKSIIELERIREQRESRFNYYKNEFIRAADHLRDQRKNMQVQLQNAELAELVYGQTCSSYEEGLYSLTEVILSQKEVLEARSLHLQSLLDIKLAEIELVNASGNINLLLNN